MNIKKIMPVIILMIAVVTVLNINKVKEIPMAITESLSTSTELIVDDNINKDVADAYINNWETLPESLKSNATSLNITGENLSDKFDLNLNANILAISYGTDIYVNDTKFNKNVLIHELFHVFDYSNNWISNSDEFMEIYDKEKNLVSVTDGNAQNVYEFFASSGELFYFEPEVLKEKAPLTYNFFVKNINI